MNSTGVRIAVAVIEVSKIYLPYINTLTVGSIELPKSTEIPKSNEIPKSIELPKSTNLQIHGSGSTD